MPVFSSGILVYKQLLDRVYRHLIIEGLSVDAAKSAVDSLKSIMQSRIEELGVKDDDVIRVEIEYEIVDSEVSWKEDTLKLVLYKPIDEFKDLIEEKEKLLNENKQLKDKINNLKEKLRELRDRLSGIIEEI